jgi:tetratricopeptide (TPR) repeat protein
MEDVKKQSLSMIVERAEAAKNAKDYVTAIALFKAASENDPHDIFLQQRLALVTYKSREGDEDDVVAIAALKDAEKILAKKCGLFIANDPETLGLGGAVYKRLHERTDDMSYFDKCIDCYERGFYIKQDYYNGINVAYMYTLKANLVDNEFEAIVNYGHANMIREKVAKICRQLISSEGFQNRGDKGWIYQTLAQAYLGLEQEGKVQEILNELESSSNEAFDMETFRRQNEKLINAMDEFKRRVPAGGKLPTAAPTESAPAPSTGVTVPNATPANVSQPPGGPISIDLGSHQDKPVKSIEVTCKVKFN